MNVWLGSFVWENSTRRSFRWMAPIFFPIFFPAGRPADRCFKSFRGRSSVTRVQRKLKHEIKLLARACVYHENVQIEREILKMMVVSSFSFFGRGKRLATRGMEFVVDATLWTMENNDIPRNFSLLTIIQN